MNSIFPPFLFRYFEQCVIGQNCETQNRLQKSVFTHVASNYSNLLEQKKKEFTEEKSSTPKRLVWNTNMAALLMFWDTNMADMMSL